MSDLTATRVVGAEAPTPADFLALLKPRVMSLVCFTALAGMAVAPGGLHPVIAFTALLCIAIGAGAAGAINMWYDRDIDVLMSRTRDRPIPAGRMSPDAALGFGITLAVASVAVMGLAVNHLAAALLALTIGFYVLVYTLWLKRRTPLNIVIGGAAGALPPVIGWAAVSGEVTLLPILMFAIIFVWTPPHFWALALLRRDDYAAAGVPMLPVVAGAAATRRQILAYSLVLAPLALAPVAVGFSGWLYGLGAVDWATVAQQHDLGVIVTRDPVDTGPTLSGANGHGALFEVDIAAMLDQGFRYEDLVAAVDVVLTKPGYGIIAECAANDTALVYASRGDFAEYAVLVEAMPRLLRCAYIEQRDLFAGRWAPVVRQVLDQPPLAARPATDGAQVVARGLAEYLGTGVTQSEIRR